MVLELGVARDEFVVADHQDRFGIDLELGEQGGDALGAGQRDLSTGVPQEDLHRVQGTGGRPGSRSDSNESGPTRADLEAVAGA